MSPWWQWLHPCMARSSLTCYDSCVPILQGSLFLGSFANHSLTSSLDFTLIIIGAVTRLSQLDWRNQWLNILNKRCPVCHGASFLLLLLLYYLLFLENLYTLTFLIWHLKSDLCLCIKSTAYLWHRVTVDEGPFWRVAYSEVWCAPFQTLYVYKALYAVDHLRW